MRTGLRTILLGGDVLERQIKALFANGEKGGVLTPWDFSSMWQDTARTTPVTAVGQPVGSALLRYSGGVYATQGTAAARPTVEIDANGRYYLDFKGVDDRLLIPDNAGLRLASMAFFLGINPGTLSAREDWLACGEATVFSTNNYVLGNSATNFQLYPRTPESVVALGAIAANTKHVITLTTDGTNVYPRINGVAGASAVATLGTNNTTGVSIGGNLAAVPTYAAMSLYGLILRGGSISSSQIVSAEKYINRRTGAY